MRKGTLFTRNRKRLAMVVFAVLLLAAVVHLDTVPVEKAGLGCNPYLSGKLTRGNCAVSSARLGVDLKANHNS